MGAAEAGAMAGTEGEAGAMAETEGAGAVMGVVMGVMIGTAAVAAETEVGLPFYILIILLPQSPCKHSLGCFHCTSL